MAVVKANAYGHGDIECALRLESEGVDWFGVALPEEGVRLRNSGIAKPILCLGSFWQNQEKLLTQFNLTPVIYDIEKALILNKFGKDNNLRVKVHVKLDTGMGRLGVRFDEAELFADKLKRFDNLEVQGIMTHFAAADDLAQNEFTQLQIDRFNECVEHFRYNGFTPAYLDLANSPGAIVHEKSRGNMIRLGGILYGLGGDVLPKAAAQPHLKPVMSLFSEVTHLKKVPKGETLGYSRTFETKRESLVAMVPIGYHDGYRRGLSNKARVVINGTFAPVVGRISMDWTIVDVTDVPGIKVGDEVVLIGEQNGLAVTAEELAGLIDTISYEITCGIKSRVYRRFIN